MTIFWLNDAHCWEEVEQPKAPRLWTDEMNNAYHAAKKVWRLATIGVGSSIAYYLNAMWQVSTRFGYDHTGTVMFGRVDAWDSSVRGDGFINHEWQNIGQWSALGVQRYQREYAERQDFAWENAFQVWRVCQDGGTHVPQNVTSISKLGDVFCIETESGNKHLAAKVVCGMGAGPHFKFGGPRGPVPTSKEHELDTYTKLGERVVDLDTFMRKFPRPSKSDAQPRGKVVVHGTNAGIDAVQRAREWGYEVVFLGSSSDAAWLRGNRLSVSPQQSRLTSAPQDGAEVTVTAIGRNRPTVEPSDGGMRVKYKPEGGLDTEIEAAYYVIALGQDANAEGAIGNVLAAGKLEPKEFEPIYDTNQIFGLPYQTVLGLQTKGTRWSSGLQVVGAAADALARTDGWKAVAHNYVEQYEIPETDYASHEQLAVYVKKQNATRKVHEQLTVEGVERAASMRRYRFEKATAYLKEMTLADLMTHQIDPSKLPASWMKQYKDSTPYLSTLEQPAATAISSVLGAAQLGAVRATMAAMHSMIPDYMLGSDSEANFTADDRTMLAVYIAQNYPNIPPVRANSLVEEIIAARRTSLNKKVSFTTGSVDATDLGFDDAQAKMIARLLAETDQIWKRIHA